MKWSLRNIQITSWDPYVEIQLLVVHQNSSDTCLSYKEYKKKKTLHEHLGVLLSCISNIQQILCLYFVCDVIK